LKNNEVGLHEGTSVAIEEFGGGVNLKQKTDLKTLSNQQESPFNLSRSRKKLRIIPQSRGF